MADATDADAVRRRRRRRRGRLQSIHAADTAAGTRCWKRPANGGSNGGASLLLFVAGKEEDTRSRGGDAKIKSIDFANLKIQRSKYAKISTFNYLGQYYVR